MLARLRCICGGAPGLSVVAYGLFRAVPAGIPGVSGIPASVGPGTVWLLGPSAVRQVAPGTACLLGSSAARHTTAGGIWFTGGHRVSLVCTTARRRHFPCMRGARALDIAGKASVLVAKRSESHPGCAEETWLRRGHPVGKHGTARTGQAGNAFPRTVSAPHGARTWLPSFIRYRRFGNEMLQVQPRRPHQR